MFEVLIEAQYACKISKGLFNVTIGKATKIWRNYKNQAVSVPTGLIEEVLKCVDCNNYKLSKKRKQLIKSKDCFDFDFGGIAKGYIAQRVSIFLKKEGYNRHLIDAGGDLVIGKAPLRAKGWKIKKEGSVNDYLLENISVATSGSTYQQIDDTNTFDTHIINPLKKGKSKLKDNDATTFHKSGMRADWMATWEYLKQRG
jgi:thiamine biosynthesis lipoprotein